MDINSSVTLGECPDEPIPEHMMKQMLNVALKKEYPGDMSEVTESGPVILAVLLKHNPEFASDIVWSLMNVGFNLMMKGLEVEKVSTEVLQ